MKAGESVVPLFGSLVCEGRLFSINEGLSFGDPNHVCKA